MIADFAPATDSTLEFLGGEIRLHGKGLNSAGAGSGDAEYEVGGAEAGGLGHRGGSGGGGGRGDGGVAERVRGGQEVRNVSRLVFDTHCYAVLET